MTVQTSKNPQVDIAEDNAFFPSEYSLANIPVPSLILMAWTIQNRIAVSIKFW
ncbi:chaperone protein [Escherichia coli]|uniref:Chaperone protein n=1 Tax=Escherichia coli TaxID=562 RepID=A0A376VRS4_ECOLX|nr:chaperone protein [Escherichia coli]